MLIQYTIEEFNSAKNSDKLPFKCEHCGNIFYRRKIDIINAI